MMEKGGVEGCRKRNISKDRIDREREEGGNRFSGGSGGERKSRRGDLAFRTKTYRN